MSRRKVAHVAWPVVASVNLRRPETMAGVKLPDLLPTDQLLPRTPAKESLKHRLTPPTANSPKPFALGIPLALLEWAVLVPIVGVDQTPETLRATMKLPVLAPVSSSVGMTQEPVSAQNWKVAE